MKIPPDFAESYMFIYLFIFAQITVWNSGSKNNSGYIFHKSIYLLSRALLELLAWRMSKCYPRMQYSMTSAALSIF